MAFEQNTLSRNALGQGVKRRVINARSFVAFCMLAVAALFLWHTFDDHYSTGLAATVEHALALPRFLLAFILLLGTVALVQDIRQETGNAAARSRLAVYAIMAVLVVAALALPRIGFVLAITPLVAVIIVALGERRWYVALGATVIVGPGLWFLFHHVLLIRLPSLLSGGLL